MSEPYCNRYVKIQAYEARFYVGAYDGNAIK